MADMDRRRHIFAASGRATRWVFVLMLPRGLWCTNPMRDSFRESSMVAGRHEQTDTLDLQDPELAGL